MNPIDIHTKAVIKASESYETLSVGFRDVFTDINNLIANPVIYLYRKWITKLYSSYAVIITGPSEAGRLGRLEPPHIFTNNLRLHVIERDRYTLIEQSLC